MSRFCLFAHFVELVGPLSSSTPVVLLLSTPILFFSVIVYCGRLYCVTEYYDSVTLHVNTKSCYCLLYFELAFIPTVHAASRHGTPSLTSLPKDGGVSCFGRSSGSSPFQFLTVHSHA